MYNFKTLGSIWSAMIALTTLVQPTFAQKAKEIVEAEITKTFIPKKGYDTNDDVHFFVEGILPSHCYTLIESKPTFTRETQEGKIVRRVFEYRQLAKLETTGSCSAEELKKPENLYKSLPRHFSYVEVYLPQVNLEMDNQQAYTGPYVIRSFNKSGPQERIFNVKLPNDLNQKNDFDYGSVMDVSVGFEVKENNPVEIEVSVWLSNSCQQFEDADIQYEIVDDVIIVRPLIRGTSPVNPEQPNEPVYCLQVMRPSTARAKVKEHLAPGRYLVHTRSRDGKGWNNAFSVE